MKTKTNDGSYIHNCIITLRQTPFSEEPLPDALFEIPPGGEKMITRLDGYTVVPREMYEDLQAEVERLKSDNAYLLQDRDRLNNDLQRAGQVFSASCDDYAQQLADQRTAMQGLVADLEASRRIAATHFNNFEAASTERDRLQAEVERLKKEIRELNIGKGSSITGQEADTLREALEAWNRDADEAAKDEHLRSCLVVKANAALVAAAKMKEGRK